MKKKIIIFISIIYILHGCKLLPKEKWELSALDKVPNKKILSQQVQYKEEGNDEVKYLNHPFVGFVNAHSNATSKCKDYKLNNKQGNDDCIKEIKYFIDHGINLSNRLCEEWFSGHLRDDSKIKQQQGIMNVAGDAALALGGLFEASTNATGAFSVLLGGANNGFEIYKKYNLLVEDAIESLESGIRVGREKSANNLKRKILKKNITFPLAQSALREYHNTCSRIQLVKYIKASVELSEYKPKLIDFKKEKKISDLSTKLFKIVYGDQDGTFIKSDLEKLYKTAFANDSLKKQIIKQYPFIAKVDDIVKSFKDIQQNNYYATINNIGVLLGLDKSLKIEANLAENKKEIEAQEKNIKGITNKEVVSFNQATDKIFDTLKDKVLNRKEKKGIDILSEIEVFHACEKAFPSGTHVLFTDLVNNVVKNISDDSKVNFSAKNITDIVSSVAKEKMKPGDKELLKEIDEAVESLNNLKRERIRLINESNDTEDTPIQLRVYSKFQNYE